MVKGLGTDITDVERIEQKISRNTGFKEMVFSQQEIAYCDRMTFPAQHYAARFAAKEAFFKALGTGWLNGTAFNEVEIIHDEKGKPEIILSGDTKRTVAALGYTRILVSISHLKTIATATVIIEQ